MTITQQHGGPSAGGATLLPDLPTLEVDWSNLPPELLHFISKKLPELADFVRFRAVCTRWQSATPLSDHPPQLPWLLQFRGPDHDPDPSLLRFFSLSSGKTLTIDAPQASSHWLFGTSLGYMMAVDSKATSTSLLLNPLTKKQIQLPFLKVLAYHPVYIDPNGEYVFVSGYLSGEKEFWASCKPSDGEWKVIALEDESLTVEGDAYFKGMYFANDMYTKSTKVIDVSTQTVKYVIPPLIESDSFSLPSGSTYLVESSGEILRVFLHYDQSSSMEECFFYMHRLDFGNGNPCWVKIKGIDDRVLFLDFFHGLSVSSTDFPGFRGNCIYFLREREHCDGYPMIIPCRYDIEKGRAQALACPIDKGRTWLVPRLF